MYFTSIAWHVDNWITKANEHKHKLENHNVALSGVENRIFQENFDQGTHKVLLPLKRPQWPSPVNRLMYMGIKPQQPIKDIDINTPKRSTLKPCTYCQEHILGAAIGAVHLCAHRNPNVFKSVSNIMHNEWVPFSLQLIRIAQCDLRKQRLAWRWNFQRMVVLAQVSPKTALQIYRHESIGMW